jgi:hypothetical protein
MLKETFDGLIMQHRLAESKMKRNPSDMNFRRDSTESLWRRALFSDQELSWLKSAFRVRPSAEAKVVDTPLRSRMNLLGWVESQTKIAPMVRTKIAPMVRVTLGEEYDLRSCRDLARRRRRPMLAPHGLFRVLVHGNDYQAVEFLSKFGPLELDSFDPNLGSESFWLNLEEFWARHARFVAAVGLWEARDHSQWLRDAWRRVHRLVPEIEGGASLPFASMSVDWDRVGLRTRTEQAIHEEQEVELPWQRSRPAFEEWLDSSTDQKLRNWAIAVVSHELGVNAAARTPTWRYERSAGHDQFTLTLTSGTLWNTIWEFFAEDTSDRGGWRVCPHCGKVFYPPRKDRMYCTTRLQQLASKREYARRSRAEAKIKS